MYQFYTPTVNYPAGCDRLFSRYRIPVGVSVLQLDGAYVMREVPSEEDLSAADRVFLGGHVHLVTDDVAAELTAAGFGAGLVFIP